MEPFIGIIIGFAGNFAPRGWAFCDGQLLSIAQNTALFSILGTTYGGNGQTTFALPDLRGRTIVHPGQGPGLSNRSLGEINGTESHTLIITETPAHTHTLDVRQPVTSAGGNSQTPVGTILATDAAGGTASYSTAAANGHLAPADATAAPAGGSQPHNNMQPFTCVHYIIALEGIFPSRN